ncbi:hypothetical protein AB0L63_29670 [Nocardia sp. NPDC051990]|uniref:hypothetical protein n=1 Tax=Nocardia sp. NPDC051990 TaxID=3155285 RepID=UPI00344A4426
MSYEFVVLPAGAAASPGDVLSYFRSRRGQPADDHLYQTVIVGLHGWNSRIPATARHARLRIEAAGDSVRVTAADSMDRRRTRGSAMDYTAPRIRELIEALIAGFAYEIYDARTNTLTSPEVRRRASIDIGGERTYSSLAQREIFDWVRQLHLLAAKPFLIATKRNDAKSFIQTYRNSATDYTVEIHHPVHDQRLRAAVTDGAIVAQLIWDWACDEWERLDAIDWSPAD